MKETKEAYIPVLLAREARGDRTIWEVWCPYCLKYHTHGAGAGHRVAHCVNPCGGCRLTTRKHRWECNHANPFQDTGYFIAKTPAEVRECMRRSKQQERESEKAARKTARIAARKEHKEFVAAMETQMEEIDAFS